MVSPPTWERTSMKTGRDSVTQTFVRGYSGGWKKFKSVMHPRQLDATARGSAFQIEAGSVADGSTATCPLQPLPAWSHLDPRQHAVGLGNLDRTSSQLEHWAARVCRNAECKLEKARTATRVGSYLNVSPRDLLIEHPQLLLEEHDWWPARDMALNCPPP